MRCAQQSVTTVGVMLALAQSNVRTLLADARLVGVTKPDAARSTRPIAISEVMTKLAGAIGLSRVSDTSIPRQYGLLQGGAEHIVHEVRDTLGRDESLCACTLDASNAFNSVHRGAIRDALAAHRPSTPLWLFFNSQYVSAVPKMAYLSRTHTPTTTAQACIDFDSHVRRALAEIAATPLTT